MRDRLKELEAELLPEVRHYHDRQKPKAPLITALVRPYRPLARVDLLVFHSTSDVDRQRGPSVGRIIV